MQKSLFRFLLMASVVISDVATSEEPKNTQNKSKENSQPLKNTGTSAPIDEKTTVSALFDCNHSFNKSKGATQACLELGGLRIEHWQKLSNRLKLSFRINPFGSAASVKDDLAVQSQLPAISASKLKLIDAYKVQWRLKDNLELSLSDFGGATMLPRKSRLSQAGSYSDLEWDQTALSAKYFLSPLNGIEVTLTVGNGEGESGENLDPQQYGAFQMRIHPAIGYYLDIGLSQDGNNLGSNRYEHEYSKYFTSDARPELGFQTQRLLLAFVLDGNHQKIRGLELGLGYQRVTMSDLNKEMTSVPVAVNTIKASNRSLDSILVEDSTNEFANSIQKEVVELSASYKILAQYFIGFSYEDRKIKSSKVNIFQVCSYISDDVCSTDEAPTGKIAQTAITIGAGVRLDEGFDLVLDYQTNYYDKLYDKYHYSDRDGTYASVRDSVNFRMAYQWN